MEKLEPYNAELSGKNNDSDKKVNKAIIALVALFAIITGAVTGNWTGGVLALLVAVAGYFAYNKWQETGITVVTIVGAACLLVFVH